MVELPINEVALHQVHVVPTDPTAAARDIPALCQDPFLWGEAVGEQAAPWPCVQLQVFQVEEYLTCTASWLGQRSDSHKILAPANPLFIRSGQSKGNLFPQGQRTRVFCLLVGN